MRIGREGASVDGATACTCHRHHGGDLSRPPGPDEDGGLHSAATTTSRIDARLASFPSPPGFSLIIRTDLPPAPRTRTHRWSVRAISGVRAPAGVPRNAAAPACLVARVARRSRSIAVLLLACEGYSVCPAAARTWSPPRAGPRRCHEVRPRSAISSGETRSTVATVSAGAERVAKTER